MDITHDGPTLVLSGDFTVRSTFAARAAIYEGLSAHDELVVDLVGVDAIDLTSLKMLAVATRRAARDGQHLRLRNCGPAVRRMMHLSRLAHVFEVDRSAATA